MKLGYVYILTNTRNTTLYTGVTSNPSRRIWEHKRKLVSGFSKRYNLEKLVYFEQFDDIQSAIEREKQIKKYKRVKKIALIEKRNLEWNDL